MNWSILLPLGLGAVGILQGAINRQVANNVGVTHATLISNFVTLLISIAFYYMVKLSADNYPEYFQLKLPLTTYKWWYIIPPIFGFLIVTGMPLAIYKLGAVKVTVGLIAAQMVTSVMWDFFVDGIGLNMMKVAGIIFSFLSVALITLSKS